MRFRRGVTPEAPRPEPVPAYRAELPVSERERGTCYRWPDKWAYLSEEAASRALYALVEKHAYLTGEIDPLSTYPCGDPGEPPHWHIGHRRPETT